MKKAICYLFGHDWRYYTLGTLMAIAAGIKIDVFTCVRCGQAGTK